MNDLDVKWANDFYVKFEISGCTWLS